MWSVGCILAELCSGDRLFYPSDDLDHLALMDRVLNPIPEHMLIKEVDKMNEWSVAESSRECIEAIEKLQKLSQGVIAAQPNNLNTFNINNVQLGR